MAITISLPPSSPYSIVDVASIIDFISTEATVNLDSPTQFTGTGVYGGQLASYVATGSGFTTSTLSGADYVSGGTVDEIVFSTALGDITFETIDIDMAVFSPVILQDLFGIAPFAIELFLMERDWTITLGNQNDFAPRGTLVGDGVALNTEGDDVIRGMGGRDTLFSGDGDDRLFGNRGRDVLNGGKGADILKGGKGADKIFGGTGRDTLDGGEQNDILIGGGGFDRFVFRDGSGVDRIRDFNRDNREDIDLSAVTEIRTYRDLVNNHMQEVGGDVVIDDGAGTRIIIEGFQIADLGKGDFLF
ncbi:calcium-binding protein [Sedimentitalea arenosa]|uniref:Calcium-binding protein n=1 Tax=Sedimentitalea arenosa TaxID=2798803 RepID=A0A8J7JF40_9RHOB|nr:hypothetical protein [Arenibacterium arenosum]MBJ6370309.1 hypothetical protein [Arenibacterium arenosum]